MADGRAARSSLSRPESARAASWPERADAALSRPRSPRAVVLWLSAYLTLAANWPLWAELARIGGAPGLYLPKVR